MATLGDVVNALSDIKDVLERIESKGGGAGGGRGNGGADASPENTPSGAGSSGEADDGFSLRSSLGALNLGAGQFAMGAAKMGVRAARFGGMSQGLVELSRSGSQESAASAQQQAFVRNLSSTPFMGALAQNQAMELEALDRTRSSIVGFASSAAGVGVNLSDQTLAQMTENLLEYDRTRVQAEVRANAIVNKVGAPGMEIAANKDEIAVLGAAKDFTDALETMKDALLNVAADIAPGLGIAGR